MGAAKSSANNNTEQFDLPSQQTQEVISKAPDVVRQPEQKESSSPFKLSLLTIPTRLFHSKTGHTLCTNNQVLVLQVGPTTIEIRSPPEFKPKNIPWRNGVLRDIIWCDALQAFILLTKSTVFTLKLPAAPAPYSVGLDASTESVISQYSSIKPNDEQSSFWRCTCIDMNLFITYTGFGTTIDEYALTPSSCKLVKRWLSPKTCSQYEGIWCIRYHREVQQLGFAIIDGRNEQWRLEVRQRENFTCLWKIALPFLSGDCEIFPLPQGEWLATNSFNIRIIQIAREKLKSAVEYERELKNAIVIKDLYLVVRTKSTIELHRLDSKK